MKTPKTKSETCAEFIDRSMYEYAQITSSLKGILTAFNEKKVALSSEFTPQITILETARELAFEKLSEFATIHQEYIFPVKKSYTTNFGTFGFRFGQRHFALNGTSTWDTVLKLLKQLLPQYVKVTEAPSKTKMMADCDLPAVKNLLPALGLSAVQDENFFIDVA